jgi:hypothetical protein
MPSNEMRSFEPVFFHIREIQRVLSAHVKSVRNSRIARRLTSKARHRERSFLKFRRRKTDKQATAV